MEAAAIKPELISVLMPFYNPGAFLKPAIDSILNQSYPHFELILVNDGSNDQSEEIVTSFDDPRIIYIKNDINLGLIASLNKAIKRSGGKFLARMDADDLAISERFELQLDYFISHPETVVIGTDYYLLNGNRKKRLRSDDESEFLKANLLFSTSFCHPTVMINKELVPELLYEENFKYAEDYRLWTKLAKAGKFTNLQIPLLLYRHNANQVSNRYRHEQLAVSAEIRKSYCGELGFRFEPAQLEALNRVGDNIRLKSMSELKETEDLFYQILEQNKQLKCFQPESLHRLLQKYWLDVCGSTSLGWRAYRCCIESPLSSGTGYLSRFKVLLKSLIRKNWL